MPVAAAALPDPLAATLFSIANAAVMPAWLLLAALPRWRGSQIVAAFVAPLLIGAAYAILIFGVFAKGGGAGGGGGADMFSLAGVMRLFDDPRAVLAGWLHYLAFDLFVGAWQVRDALRRGLPHLLLLPCLALTLMLGPLGLLTYLMLRLALRRAVDPDPDNASIRQPGDEKAHRNEQGDAA